MRLDNHPFGLHRGREIVGNGVGHRFVINTFVPEALVIQFEAFQFNAMLIGAIAENDIAEIRVTGLGADAGELFADVFNHEVFTGAWRIKTFQEGGIWHGRMLGRFARYVYPAVRQSSSLSESGVDLVLLANVEACGFKGST